MAHNLNIIDGQASFATTFKPAWHGLGTVLSERMTAEEALKEARLDYEVRKIPTTYNLDGTVYPTGHFATHRMDTHQHLGNVGKRYTVLQNEDAFKFFDPIVDRDEAIYETAGALGDGEVVFLTAKLPEHIQVGKDDLVEMFVVLWNSHDGSAACQAIITPVRVVCNNTLNAARSQAKAKVTIRHTASMEDRLANAAQILGVTSKLQSELSAIFGAMSDTKVSDRNAGQMITKFFTTKKEYASLSSGEDARDVLSTRKRNIIDKAYDFYHTGIGQQQALGTAWGVYNGLTGYLSHEKSYTDGKNKMTSLLVKDDTTRAMNLVLSEMV